MMAMSALSFTDKVTGSLVHFRLAPVTYTSIPSAYAEDDLR